MDYHVIHLHIYLEEPFCCMTKQQMERHISKHENMFPELGTGYIHKGKSGDCIYFPCKEK